MSTGRCGLLRVQCTGLFAREDDRASRDGKTGVLYKAGTQVATLTVDAKGNASVEDLYLGKYYVKELTPPVGYLRG